MKEYNPNKIEPKWQKKWEKSDLYKAEDFSKKPKQYILVEFPYPSGEGLHVGHARSYCALDTIARKKRMEGYNVLFPMGWDAFGLPTENYAIKTGIHPQEATEKNIKNYTRQIKSLGLSVDWKREINTTDPKYYKWTQWIFLKFFEKGLAYQAKIPINWCPSCKIGLANEEVIDGKCERCGAQTIKREIKQWLLKITAYADKLIEGLKNVDFPDRVKAQQINWIGRSEGTEVDFPIVIARSIATKQSCGDTERLLLRQSADRNDDRKTISIFTTRADTIFGVTALILAPENPVIKNLESRIKNWDDVNKYIEKTKKKSDLERASENRERTGIELKGIEAVNPANNEKIPVWIADYVLAHYGGGAVMMVPAHDKRDWDFAKKYDLPIKEVIVPEKIHPTPPLKKEGGERIYVEYGKLINSGEFNGLESEEAIKKITKWLEEKKLGKKKVEYKLRDWVFSRQHYWGEPIPIIHCGKCGSTGSPQAVPVQEKDLPVVLPHVEKYQPTDTGESPLAAVEEWVSVKCPKCGGMAKRETDTMPNWAGSSWYFLRYIDPKNNKKFADEKKLEYWLEPARNATHSVAGGIDLYNGGMEHTTLHLLYSRFWHKFLYDLELVPTAEPYAKRTSHGMVLAEDNRKMSKSWGNVINPDEMVKIYGADAVRVYEMFMGPFEQAISWNTNGLVGCVRFLRRVWDLFFNLSGKISDKAENGAIQNKLHQLVKKVDEDMEEMKFNTAIAAFMEFVNLWFEEGKSLTNKDAENFLKLLSPFAPHLAEELWEKLKHKKSIFCEKWPEYDVELIKEEVFELVMQVNGKVRDKVEAKIDILEEEAKKLALAREQIKKWVEGKEIKKVIFVKDRLINLII